MSQQTVQVVNKVANGGTKTPPDGGVVNFNILSGSTLILREPASGNFSLNFRGNGNTSLASLVTPTTMLYATLVYTNLTKPFRPVNFLVDNAVMVPDFINGLAPSSAPSNRLMVYKFRFYNLSGTIRAFCEVENYAPGSSGQALSAR